MNFEEWLEENYSKYEMDSDAMVQAAWSAAIDEAVKIADKHANLSMDDANYYSTASSRISEEVEGLKK